MKNNEFQCEDCGNIYEKGWTNEEASAESQAAFGIATGAIVCDDCYNKIMFARAKPADVKDIRFVPSKEACTN